MEDLALTIDEQNAEDWKRLPALASHECRQDQPGNSIQISEHQSPFSHQSSHDDQPAVLTEGCEDDRRDTSWTAATTLEDTIRKYIPDDSHARLALKQRKTSAWFMEGYETVWARVQELHFDFSINMIQSNRQVPAMILVHDINLDWCKALCARFKAALNPELLAGQIIRFDEISSVPGDAQAVKRDLAIRYPNAKVEIHSSGNFILMEMTSSGNTSTLMAAERAFRVGLTFGASRGKAYEHLSDLRFGTLRSDDISFRQDTFERDELNRWRRITAFTTCLCLEENLYLVLLDSLPMAASNSVEGHRPRILRIDHRLDSFSDTQKLLPCLAHTEPEVMLDSIFTLFRRHTMQSVLHPRNLPGWRRLKPHGHRMSPNIFTWLYIESNWRLSVTQLEMESQQLQREATSIAGDEAFTKLTSLRRRLADAYGTLVETQETVDNELKEGYPYWNVDCRFLGAGRFWSQKRAQRGKPVAGRRQEAQSIDIRDLPDLLEEYVGRIKTMTKTVNEEIQMVIGSVQVEDARVMRRQTEWTVVLAVLAAIYLPMTLVTGIFGMNITEIGEATTRPDRWSVVRAWGIVFGATMGSVLVYAVARYVLRYRRVGRMLLRRRMRNIGDGRMYQRVIAFKARLQDLWLYRKIDGFKEKMREWDVEAQKMEKME